MPTYLVAIYRTHFGNTEVRTFEKNTPQDALYDAIATWGLHPGEHVNIQVGELLETRSGKKEEILTEGCKFLDERMKAREQESDWPLGEPD